MSCAVDRNGGSPGIQGRARRIPIRHVATILAGVLTAALLGIGSSGAATIPAWLDDAISAWNKEHADLKIQFVDIKDSYVWYMIPDTPETDGPKIRESIYGIVTRQGYEITDQEEMIVTAKPPSPTSPYEAKKCWSRSYVRNVEELSNTRSTSGGRSGMRQKMLTSLVCEDTQTWFAGFRILQ